MGSTGQHTVCVWHPSKAVQCGDGTLLWSKCGSNHNRQRSRPIESISGGTARGHSSTILVCTDGRLHFKMCMPYLTTPMASSSVHMWVPDHEHLLLQLQYHADLDFADNITLHTTMWMRMQDLLTNVEQVAL